MYDDGQQIRYVIKPYHTYRSKGHVMNIHFSVSENPEAIEKSKDLINHYGNTSIEDCDVIVALGGDGQMLKSHSKMTFDNEKPVYGTSCRYCWIF